MNEQRALRLPAVLVGLFVSLLLCLPGKIFAQAPGAIPYQAVARNSSGNLLQNQTVSLRFSIHDGTAGGTVVYQETHTATTNALGLFSVNIGQGTVVSGTLAAIDWGTGSKFTQVEMDPAGGTGYVDMGTTQMLSVPYALYAGSSAETDPQVSATTTGSVPRWNGISLADGSIFDTGTNVGLGIATPAFPLHVKSTAQNIAKFQGSSALGTWVQLSNSSTGGKTWSLISTGSSNGEGPGNFILLDNNVGARLMFDGGGNAGFGTTSPNARVHASTPLPVSIIGESSNAIGTWLTLNNTSAGGSNWNLISTGSANGAGNFWLRDNSQVRMAIQSSTGNVGIGTTAPSQTLDVSGTTKTTNLQLTSGAANGYLLKSDAGGNASWAAPATVFTDTDDQTLSLSGTDLSIDGGNSVSLYGLADNLGNHTATQNLKTNGHWISKDGDSEGLFIEANGSVGIGLQNDNAPLIVKASSNPNLNFNGILVYNQTETSGNNAVLGAKVAGENGGDPFVAFDVEGVGGWALGVDNSDADKFKISSDADLNDSFTRLTISKTDGNVGIGTTSPAQKLDVNGTTRTSNLQMTAGAANGYVLKSDASGNGSWADPATLFTGTDDQTLSLSGSTLSISEGNSVNLSGLFTNFWSVTGNDIYKNNSGNVGIGTDNPSGLLHVADGNFISSGTYGSGPAFPVSGAGTRMFFYPKKGAFRAGYVSGSQWDDTNIGDNSFAGGVETTASGIGSVAIGAGDNASGNFSTALGFFTTASGVFSTAIGMRASTNGYSGAFTIADNPATLLNFNATAADQFSARFKGGYRFYTDNAETEANALFFNGGKLGIGTSAPGQKLEVNGTAKTTNLQMTSGAANGYVLQSDASGNASWINPTTLSITETDPQVSSSTSGRVPRWNGTSLSDGSIFDSGTKVGIGTTSPSYPLDIQGTANTLLYLQSSSSTGSWLTLNNTGTGGHTWSLISSGNGNSEGAGSLLFNNASNGTVMAITQSKKVGIGTFSPEHELEVSGTTQTNAIKITDNASNGYVLRSDADGNGTWVNPATLSISETDPQVGSTTTGRVPRWNGTTLLDGSIFDNGVNIGIGTTSPSFPLHVSSGFQSVMNVESISPNGTWFVLDNNSTGGVDWNLISTGSSASTGAGDFWLRDGSNVRMAVKSSNGNVGIGTTSPGQKLEVSGTTKTTGLQMTNGATSGYVLQSDASGNASWVNPATLSIAIPSKIQDADADTKIQTEESADEDKIRFDLGGTEYLVLQSGRMYTKNIGNSVFLGENAGAADDLTTNENVAVGYSALAANVSNNKNTAVGYKAMSVSTGAIENVAFGHNALASTTNGDYNTGVGAGVMSANTVGNLNTALGNSALYSNTGGDENVVLGSNALYELTDGNKNVAIGSLAGYTCQGSGNIFIGSKAGFSEAGSNKLYIDNNGDINPLIWGDFENEYVNFNANVGIGTTTPTQAKLVVNGSESTSIGGFGFFNSSGNSGTSSGTHSYSIYASNRIAGQEFNAHSDARIKNVKGQSDSRADLQTLMGIKITDYTLKDTVEKGNHPYKKVVAQQVEQVYPQAVNTLTDVVPDIYQLSEIKGGFVQLPNCPLRAGERVKLIFSGKQEIVPVLRADATGFQVDLPDQGQVFVYGREVNDFRTVDYEALSMLNISATQELLTMIRQQQASIEALKADNAALKATNAGMQSDIQSIKAALHLDTTVAGQK